MVRCSLPSVVRAKELQLRQSVKHNHYWRAGKAASYSRYCRGEFFTTLSYNIVEHFRLKRNREKLSTRLFKYTALAILAQFMSRVNHVGYRTQEYK